MYFNMGPKQLFFQCGAETPKGWTSDSRTCSPGPSWGTALHCDSGPQPQGPAFRGEDQAAIPTRSSHLLRDLLGDLHTQQEAPL